jgi:hypothetical protein
MNTAVFSTIISMTSKVQRNAMSSSTAVAPVTSLTVGSTRTKMLRIFAG